jgi:hypothetical protein
VACHGCKIYSYSPPNLHQFKHQTNKCAKSKLDAAAAMAGADEDMGSMHMTMLGESHEGQRDQQGLPN